ncbi:MAG: hypothetical protein AB1631_30980 [Acidobacteriota bacterium]
MPNLSAFTYPGVVVNDEPFGAIPLGRKNFQTVYMVGAAKRGPTNKFVFVTSLKKYHEIFGPRYSGSYLHHAMRAIEDNAEIPAYILRAIGANALKAEVILDGGGTSQVEAATVVGTITGSGNATVILTAAGFPGSPKTYNVAVLNGDTASVVAGKIRAALAADTDVTDRYTVGGTGATVILTRLVHAANDATLNISIDNGTCTGLTAAPTSANTTAGVADHDVLKIKALGEGADYNYAAGPPAAGVSVKYIDGVLSVYDGSTLKERYRDVVFSKAALSAETINGQSNLIEIEWLDSTVNPINYTAQTGLAGGADGDALVDANYVATIALLQQKELSDGTRKPLGWYMCPGITSQAVGEALITAAEEARGYALIDSTLGNSIAESKTERSLYASARGFVSYVLGWVETLDLDSNARILVPRSPFVAALWARSHNLAGSIANVGAGVEFKLRGALGLEINMDDLTQGELNEQGIDCARNFRSIGYGLVQWAARTISPEVLYRFRHVRIILNVIAETLEIGLLPYVFKPFDGRGVLASEIKGSINNLLYSFWNADVLFGATAADAFLVRIDPDLTELEQGVVSVSVFVKPTPIAERINVTLYRVPISFDFNTGQTSIGDPEKVAA